MNYKNENLRLETILQRHSDFWKRKNGQAVLQRVPFVKWHTKPYPVKGRNIADPECIKPDDIDIDRFLGLGESLPKPNTGNRINTVMPRYPQSWMSGIIGCDICASSVSCTAVGGKFGSAAEASEQFRIDEALGSEWYALLQLCTDALIEYAGSKIAVSQMHLRGIIDMLAAYFKEDELCMAAYDYKEAIKTLAHKFAKLYITVAKNDISKRGMWKGGQAVSWGVYAPGELLSYQIDASNLFSRSMYEDIFLGFDEMIINEFEYSLCHIHYTGLHVAQSLCSIENLGCIQINLDREAAPDWSLEKVIDCCKTVQSAGKCVLINGELEQYEVNRILEELEQQGLMMIYWNPEYWDPTDIK